MKNMTLSIIIPCYNVQKYLGDLFESLKPCGQDVEIIFVDDGSPDKSGSMCDAFAKAAEPLPLFAGAETFGCHAGTDARRGRSCADSGN